MEDENTVALIKEIRDLLIPIAAHYRPEYEEQLRIEKRQKAERLAQMVRGRQARNAVLMMDGTNEQAQIRKATGIASSNLSPLITRLAEEGMVEDASDRRKPELIFSQEELQEILGGQNE